MIPQAFYLLPEAGSKLDTKKIKTTYNLASMKLRLNFNIKATEKL